MSLYIKGKEALFQGFYKEALQCANSILQHEPSNVDALWLRIDALDRLHRYDDVAKATLALPAAIPRTASFLTEQSRVLLQAKYYTGAIQSALLALQLDSNNALTHVHMGMALAQSGYLGEAIVSLERAWHGSPPEHTKLFILSQLVHTLRNAVCWKHLEEHTSNLIALLDAMPQDASDQVNAFFLLALHDNPGLQRKQSRQIANALSKGIDVLPKVSIASESTKIKVGYLSSYFGNTACMHLMRGMLSLHDTTQFEITLYDYSQRDGSPIQKEISGWPHRIVNVQYEDNKTIARRIQNDAIDILIDLNGYTDENRHGVFAHRPAPVQVTMVGYPGTSGASYMDYILGDPTVSPIASQAEFQECIAQMPHCYLPTDNTQSYFSPIPRSQLGLPEHAVVYNCFNQFYKITPAVADAWAAILKNVPQSVLWLAAWNTIGATSLRQEMANRGIESNRLVFAPLVSSAQNHARMQAADLYLDTWPYNGHTTTSESLWSGVPTLTLSGSTFASRVGASLVRASELPLLHCTDVATYIERGIALGKNPNQLKRMKNHLLHNRTILPAFNTPAYTKNFEKLLKRMHLRRTMGLPPAPLPAE